MAKKMCNKICRRNLWREKGKSFCVFVGIWLAVFLGVTVGAAFDSIRSAAAALERSGRAWLGDAGVYVYSDEQARAVQNDGTVLSSCVGYHLGEITDSQGYVQTELSCYTEEIARWMNCYPTQGRMPETEKEVVVSDEFLKECGGTYPKENEIQITYSVGDRPISDTFTVVGVYEKTNQKNMILVSEAYYAVVRKNALQNGAGESDFPILV